jgi:hypothetical protein
LNIRLGTKGRGEVIVSLSLNPFQRVKGLHPEVYLNNIIPKHLRTHNRIKFFPHKSSTASYMTKTNRLILLRGIIVLYSKDKTKLISTLCGAKLG